MACGVPAAALAWLLPALLAADVPAVERNRPPAAWKVDVQFSQALEAPISAAWDQARLRRVLSRLSAEREIALLLDRRLDPDREITLSADSQTTRQLLESLAAPVGGGVSIVGNVAYLGPQAGILRLRTLVRLRRDELASAASGIAAARRTELGRRFSLQWQDLESPTAVLERIGERCGANIIGLDEVPHDLWAGATLPQVDAVEALSLILVQFDRTFQWEADGAAVRIVSVPEVVVVERTIPLDKLTVENARGTLGDTLPQVEIAQRQDQLVLRGTLEQLEAAEALLRPGASARPVAKAGRAPPLRKNQRYSLTVKDAPLRAVLKGISRQAGVEFQFDEAALMQAGVELDQRISLSVRQVTLENLLEEICADRELTFSIDEDVVVLAPEDDGGA